MSKIHTVPDTSLFDEILDQTSTPEIDRLSDVTDADTYKHALQQIAAIFGAFDWFDLGTSEQKVLEIARGALGL